MEMENQNNISDQEISKAKEEALDQFYNPKPVDKNETKERKQLKDQFYLFGFSTLIYAVIYTVCMYKNLAGIASTLLVIGTVAYTYIILKKLGYSFAGKHIKYAVIIVLLGINLMVTMDGLLHFIDYLAIVMVFITGVLSVVQDNSSWDFGDSIKAIFAHCGNSLGYLLDFITDWSEFSKDKNKKSGLIGYIIVGMVITIPILAVVVVLLGGADAVFGNMLEEMFDEFNFADVIGVGFVFAGALFGAYAWMACFVNKGVKITERDKRTKEPAIMIVIGISLGLVYLFFCGIQIMYLFAGMGTLPEGYTYAEYARQGFTELMVVCLINLIIVLVGVKYFRENIVLKIVLTIITGCTYMMVASSAYRMYMYVSVYQMSMLRIWVIWTLCWLSFILTGALITIYNNRFSLFLYSMLVTSVLYIVFAYARPAYLVADYNLSGQYAEEDIDYSYLEYNLNPDASSAIYDYYMTSDFSAKVKLAGYFATNNEISENKTSVRNFNISRYNYYKIAVR